MKKILLFVTLILLMFSLSVTCFASQVYEWSDFKDGLWQDRHNYYKLVPIRQQLIYTENSIPYSPTISMNYYGGRVDYAYTQYSSDGRLFGHDTLSLNERLVSCSAFSSGVLGVETLYQNITGNFSAFEDSVPFSLEYLMFSVDNNYPDYECTASGNIVIGTSDGAFHGYNLDDYNFIRTELFSTGLYTDISDLIAKMNEDYNLDIDIDADVYACHSPLYSAYTYVSGLGYEPEEIITYYCDYVKTSVRCTPISASCILNFGDVKEFVNTGYEFGVSDGQYVNTYSDTFVHDYLLGDVFDSDVDNQELGLFSYLTMVGAILSVDAILGISFFTWLVIVISLSVLTKLINLLLGG